MHVVWFKRDLRTVDHACLVEAAQQGEVLPLYIVEPELWQQPDMSDRQYLFLQDCLNELDAELRKLGTQLVIKVGEAVDVLNTLHNTHGITALWSHQETWNDWTYKRDKRVKAWCKTNSIQWNEPTQHGVVRVLNNRDVWTDNWHAQMNKPILPGPKALNAAPEPSDTLPGVHELGLAHTHCTFLQKGGRVNGLGLLNTFLHKRGHGYTKEMSSPVTAFTSCSRLSTHIAFGTVSIKEVFQAAEQRTKQLKKSLEPGKTKWLSAMKSFSGRLRWHCHFIQKLEDEPRIEFENMHSMYNGVREPNFNTEYFEAWKVGKTGYPMIDACMRALIATGWLNFRMRAMLMSFASYHLWLHWQKPAVYLASLFTDYEPGIHYSQAQMQSGTTGINSIRIYNPIKQGIDHDSEGKFIRYWVEELKHIDGPLIHTPWKAVSQMNGYPMPIVDEKAARTAAADKLYGIRKQFEHKAEAKAIVHKHGSRKSGLVKTTGKRSKTKQTSNYQQPSLPL